MFDLSPLWISLKVALPATIFTFVLGICAARTVVKLKHGQAVIDGLFTLPLVLPPTVVGFFLLLAFGKKQPGGTVLFPVWVFLYIFLAGCGHRLNCSFISADVPHGPRRL